MDTKTALRRLPGLCALLVLVLLTTIAAITGANSLFYEGWGQPIWSLLSYLAPAAVMLGIGLIAVRRPGTGAALLLGAGVIGGGWWFSRGLASGIAPTAALLMTLAVMLVPVLAAGLLLIVDARWGIRQGEGIPRSGWRWRSVVLVLVPLSALAVVSWQRVPALLDRHDDGLRGARVIDSGGTRLVWAPKGPGWNARRADGAGLTWSELAGSGPDAPGRCAYLDETGRTLLERPAGIWRLPRVNEIVEALSRGGNAAGCVWDGRSPYSTCATPPDKETPLWAPDEAPIYYWSGEEVSPGQAFAVNYTGGIGRHSTSMNSMGFRCVKPAGSER